MLWPPIEIHSAMPCLAKFVYLVNVITSLFILIVFRSDLFNKYSAVNISFINNAWCSSTAVASLRDYITDSIQFGTYSFRTMTGLNNVTLRGIRMKWTFDDFVTMSKWLKKGRVQTQFLKICNKLHDLEKNVSSI